MDMLDLKGCVVTADALNCQKTVAAKAVEKKADYVLALNGNYPILFKEVRTYMDALASQSTPGFEQVEKDHGRIETRRCWQSDSVEWCADRAEWAGLRSFVLIEAIRERGGNISRARARNAAKNLGTLRSICLNLLRRVPGKSSLKGKGFKISLNVDFLLEALRF